jgi:beta-lactamase regulating signal transducer with metallopeptidase domain
MTLQLLMGVDGAPGLTAFVLALFCTYLIHALLWASAGTLLACSVRMSAATRHALWKLALFGPLLSTLLTTVLPRTYQDNAPPQQSVLQPLADTEAGSTPQASGDALAGFALSTSVLRPRVLTFVFACLVAASALGLMRFMVAALLLARRLHGRTRVRDARLLERLSRLCRQSAMSHVLLSESTEVASPLVVGHREICVPACWLDTLEDGEIDSVFGHELAHLERRDGVWFPLVGLLQSLLWMQPLNHWLCARFRETAELSCDDRAVALTGDATSLARALTRVAAVSSSPARHGMLPAMARAHGLRARVQRLVTERSERVLSAAGGRRWLATFALLGLLAAALSVQSARARSGRAQASSTRHGTADSSLRAPAPDATALSEQMGELVQREQDIQRALAATLPGLAYEADLALPDAERMHQEQSQRVLTLQQELRHVRATQVWLEQRFVQASVAWERTQGSPAND